LINHKETLLAQMVKNLPAMQKTQLQFGVGEIPLWRVRKRDTHCERVNTKHTETHTRERDTC